MKRKVLGCLILGQFLSMRCKLFTSYLFFSIPKPQGLRFQNSRFTYLAQTLPFCHGLLWNCQLMWGLHQFPNDILVASCMTKRGGGSHPEIQFSRYGWRLENLSWSWGWCIQAHHPERHCAERPRTQEQEKGRWGNLCPLCCPPSVAGQLFFRQLPYSCWDEARLEDAGPGHPGPHLPDRLFISSCFPWHPPLMPVPSHVANERPIQTSLADQLAFFRFPKLIMSLSLVQFQQLMYLRIHKWLFVFNLSDMFAAVLSSLGTHLSLCFVLLPL